MREQVAHVVGAYLAGLAARELASVAFHPDITFEGPVGSVGVVPGRISGPSARS